MKRWKLIADVGGTNARFARSAGPGDLQHVKKLNVSDFPTFHSALQAYLEGVDCGQCTGGSISAAGPVNRDEVVLTNAPWRIAASDVASVLGDRPVMLFNDLEAVALALPHLTSDDVRKLGGPPPDLDAKATRLAVNVGTGLGAAAAVPIGGAWLCVPSEAGHISYAATTADEEKLLGSIGSVEDLLSGRGIRRLHKELSGTVEEDHSVPEDAAIFRGAGIDTVSAEALDIFTRVLARVSGDLVLATASWGGVFFCGSVARAWSDVADIGAFRATFESKGAMTARMGNVGTSLILLPEPALYGLTFATGRRP